MNPVFSKKICVPILLTVAIALTGCEDRKKTTVTSAPQVAAKVNDTALTVPQVNFALQRIPNLDKNRVKEASLQIIRSLVDQEVVVQKALQDKLDKDPKVVQMLDAARSQILSQTYMERKLGAPTVPTAGEITAYYNQHPELFTQRKLYRLQEVSIKAPVSEYEAIRTQLASSKSLDEFAAWLKSKNYPVNATQEVKASEQLPPALLTKLQTMPDGQATVVTTPEGLLILVLAGSQPQPVTEMQARPAIERIVQAQKRQEAVKLELAKLKAAAKIEYMGEFMDAGKLTDVNKNPAPDGTAAGESTATNPATSGANTTPITK